MSPAGCGQPGCECRHVRCDRGMVESWETAGAYAWCSTCWPDRQPAQDETREEWIDRLQKQKREPAHG